MKGRWYLLKCWIVPRRRPPEDLFAMNGWPDGFLGGALAIAYDEPVPAFLTRRTNDVRIPG